MTEHAKINVVVVLLRFDDAVFNNPVVGTVLDDDDPLFFVVSTPSDDDWTIFCCRIRVTTNDNKKHQANKKCPSLFYFERFPHRRAFDRVLLEKSSTLHLPWMMCCCLFFVAFLCVVGYTLCCQVVPVWQTTTRIFQRTMDGCFFVFRFSGTSKSCYLLAGIFLRMPLLMC